MNSYPTSNPTATEEHQTKTNEATSNAESSVNRPHIELSNFKSRQETMIITVDGPAGAGKSSASIGLAQRLGFGFLDTGAMYRTVTLAAIENGLDFADTEAVEKMTLTLDVKVTGNHVLLNGRDVSDAIRTHEVTILTRHAADNIGVRSILRKWQRAVAEGQNFVTEGRDQGTEVFPDAECKIFLTASEEERANRRFHDLQSRGESVSLEEVLDKQRARDELDCSRPVGALVKADDAIEVVTDGLGLEEVINKLQEVAERCLDGRQ